MYSQGLQWSILYRFEDDGSGFDGAMLGSPGAPYHLEFSQQRGVAAPRCPSPDLLLVLYVPQQERWAEAVQRMSDAGFAAVRAHNPYWEQTGAATFEDPDGYRVVLSRADWTM